MTRTGWIGEDPDGQGPAMPATEFILANRADPGQGRTLEEVLRAAARAPDRDGPEAEDADDRAATLLTRGYSPGAISALNMKLSDVMAELADEREKLAAGARRAEQVRRMHERGQLRAWDIPNMLDDLGDEGRVGQLERQAGRLVLQIEEAQEATAPPRPRQLDGVEAASRAAHEVFRAVTRARMAELEARQVSRPASRPFAGRGLAVRSEVTCSECIKVGATPEQSFLIHQDPDAPIEADLVGFSEQALAAFGRETGVPYRPQGERRAQPSGREITRTTGNDAIAGVR